MRTKIKYWENFYAELGQIDPNSPLENKVVKQNMRPWNYKEQAKMIAKRLNAQDSVLEIGCAYGGLALEILKLISVKYTVVENKLMLIQARKFLGDKIEYIEARKIETLQNREFELFVSNFCLSETPAEYREYILENIVKNCQKISIMDFDDGFKPTSTMLEFSFEMLPLNIEKWLKNYFIIEKKKYLHNRFIYIGERRNT